MTMALVGVAMVAMIAMAGLSIDVGTLYEASAEAQRAADAGALAAARTISMQGLTGDPQETQPATWSEVCGGDASLASLAAKTVIGQNAISGASTLPTVTVNYSFYNGPLSTDCSTLGGGQAGVNMFVSVQVQQPNLPTYFSRIWGRTGNTVSATAIAEVFNSSNSNTYAGGGDVIPVQPRCVKPWIVPNIDPYLGCTTGCNPFVYQTTGAIYSPGVFQNGAGVIGERFWLAADCGSGGATCVLLGQPQANVSTVYPLPKISLQYVPGQVPSFSSAFTAIPSCASGSDTYAQAIAGCDQSTKYQCGVQLGNVVDLSENPVPNDTTSGLECLTHQTVSTTGSPTPTGQDYLLPTGTLTGGLPLNYPFQIQAGTSNPLTAVQDNIITSSNSIVSLPIYDSSPPNTINPGTTQVTIVGFLQVFVDVVDPFGNMHVTVLNVSGCGNGTTPVTTPVYGTSPVPVRLITSP